MSKVYRVTTPDFNFRIEKQDTFFRRLLVATIKEYGENGQITLSYETIESVKDNEGINYLDDFIENSPIGEEYKKLVITDDWKPGEDDEGLVEEVYLDDLYVNLQKSRLQIVKEK